jgi:hypothetical protein
MQQLIRNEKNTVKQIILKNKIIKKAKKVFNFEREKILKLRNYNKIVCG